MALWEYPSIIKASARKGKKGKLKEGKGQGRPTTSHSAYAASAADLCPTIYSSCCSFLPPNNAYTNAQIEWQMCRSYSDRLLRSSLILVSVVCTGLSAEQLRVFTVDTVCITPRQINGWSISSRTITLVLF